VNKFARELKIPFSRASLSDIRARVKAVRPIDFSTAHLTDIQETILSLP
jgi:hypothetical protein